MTANNAHELGAAIEAELTDDHWLALAAAVPDAERAHHLANPEPIRSTTVEPELTNAWLELRESLARRDEALSALLQSPTCPTSHDWIRERLRPLDSSVARDLERVEQLIAGGVR